MTDAGDRAIVPVVAEQLRNVRSTNVLFNVVVLVIIAVLGGLNAWEARKASARIDAAAECIIEQFAEHRAANEAAHRATAAKIGADYQPINPAEAPPDLLDRLAAACEPFIRSGAAEPAGDGGP